MKRWTFGVLTRARSAIVAFGVIVSSVMAADSTRLLAQDRDVPRPNLSGRWRLNQELSENAQAKVDRYAGRSTLRSEK
jgi:hypothetical protein